MAQNAKALVAAPPIGQHVPFQDAEMPQILLTDSPKGLADMNTIHNTIGLK